MDCDRKTQLRHRGVCVCVLHKHYLPVVTSLSLRCSVNLICSDGPAHPAAPGPTVQTSPTLQPPTSLLLLCSDTCLHLTQASAEAHGQTCSAHTLDFCCPLFLICAAQHKSTKTAASSTGCAERGGGPGVHHQQEEYCRETLTAYWTPLELHNLPPPSSTPPLPPP